MLTFLSTLLIHFFQQFLKKLLVILPATLVLTDHTVSWDMEHGHEERDYVYWLT